MSVKMYSKSFEGARKTRYISRKNKSERGIKVNKNPYFHPGTDATNESARIARDERTSKV